MRENITCILITGMSHSGSRLVVRMLDQHPDVTTAMPILKGQAEFAPLLELFYTTIDAAPLHEAVYPLDRGAFTFVMDAYMAAMDSDRPFCAVKIPYYPLNHLPYFLDYFGGNVRFVFTRRPADKIVRSFVSRGEDTLFFESNMPETLRQIKYLDLDERRHFLAQIDAEAIFRAQIQRCETLREQWDATHPDKAFRIFEVEQAAKSPEYVRDLLISLGLSTEPLEAVLSVIDRDRLLQTTPPAAPDSSLKRSLRSVTPPVLWRWLSRLNQSKRTRS